MNAPYQVCPFCDSPLRKSASNPATTVRRIDCHTCGTHYIDDRFLADGSEKPDWPALKRALSGALQWASERHRKIEVFNNYKIGRLFTDIAIDRHSNPHKG
jgi:hypothetical protein